MAAKNNKRGAYFGAAVAGQRAGKAKGSVAARKLQNVGVKHGAVRKGAKGKGFNVYDANTGTWRRQIKTTQSVAKGQAAGAGTRRRTEGMTSSNPYTQYRPMQAPKSSWGTSRTSGAAWYEQGGGGLAGPNSPLPGLDRKVAATAASAATGALAGFKSGVKSASTGVASAKKKLPPSKYFKQGGGGLVGWLRNR